MLCLNVLHIFYNIFQRTFHAMGMSQLKKTLKPLYMQGNTNPKRKFNVANKFCTVAPNICGSLLHVSVLVL